MEQIKNVIDVFFVVGLVLFMTLGTAMVLVQLFGVIILKGDLVVKVSDILAKPSCVIASITGLLGFVGGYFSKNKD